MLVVLQIATTFLASVTFGVALVHALEKPGGAAGHFGPAHALALNTSGNSTFWLTRTTLIVVLEMQLVFGSLLSSSTVLTAKPARERD